MCLGARDRRLCVRYWHAAHRQTKFKSIEPPPTRPPPDASIHMCAPRTTNPALGDRRPMRHDAIWFVAAGVLHTHGLRKLEDEVRFLRTENFGLENWLKFASSSCSLCVFTARGPRSFFSDDVCLSSQLIVSFVEQVLLMFHWQLWCSRM